MSYQEKIQEFIDGNISKEDEDILFELLNSDRIIRSDFKKNIALEFGMLREATELVPSNRLTGALFASLGIGATVVNTPIKSWLTGNSKPIASAIIASLLTITAFIVSDFRVDDSHLKPNIVLKDKNINESNSNQNIEHSELSQNETVDVRSSSIKDLEEYNSLSNRVNDNNNKNSKNGIEQNRQNYILNSEAEDIGIYSFQPKKISFAELYQNFESSKQYSLNINESNIQQESFLVQNQLNRNELLDKFSIKFTKFSDYVFPSKDLGLSAEDDSEFRNSAIALLYKLNDEIDLGIEYRRENIYQEFTNVEDGIEINYYQYPSLNSFGLFTSYDFINISDYGSLYSELNLGGNKAMGILRGSLGLKFDLGKYYYFDLGVQQSYYLFNNSGQYFNSTKTSIFGGLTFEL